MLTLFSLLIQFPLLMHTVLRVMLLSCVDGVCRLARGAAVLILAEGVQKCVAEVKVVIGEDAMLKDLVPRLFSRLLLIFGEFLLLKVMGYLEQMVGDVYECEERGPMGVRRFVKKFKGVITVVVFFD
ncbi:unnamed protein product [Vicia faba]|uniref:Uncharacterized protein n=1 Tax=Vicia faba TaxID=3906 RepID=A0AAV1AAS0_VICFA|nr:unnamed protein product [Vicia faba]